MPVVIPEGIAGMVTDVAKTYAKILLIIDQNSAVDAMIQRSRARGIIKGEPSGNLLLRYVLRKHDIQEGDVVFKVDRTQQERRAEALDTGLKGARLAGLPE